MKFNANKKRTLIYTCGNLKTKVFICIPLSKLKYSKFMHISRTIDVCLQWLKLRGHLVRFSINL